MDYHIIRSVPVEKTLVPWIINECKRVIFEKDLCSIALSGGTSPSGLYRELNKAPLPWDKIHLFQVDERVVPPDHEDSNLRMLKRELLAGIGISPGHCHWMTESENYAQDVSRFLSKTKSPGFDITILGLGADGHTASLFPGKNDDWKREEWAFEAFSETHKHRRITLSFGCINSSSLICLLVKGNEKKEALLELLRGSPEIPAVMLDFRKTVIFTDIDIQV